MKDLLHKLLLSILLFAFIYTFQLPGLPRGVLSYRVVLILLFVYAVFFKQNSSIGRTQISAEIVKGYVSWNVFLTIYVIMILTVFGHAGVGSHESTNDYVNMVIVLPLFYYAGRRIFKSLDDFMWVMCAVGLIQSFIIIAGTMSPAINAALTLINSDSSFAEDERMEYMMASGYHLGFKCFTSLGSLQMAISQIAAWYFIERKNNLYAFLAFLVISFSSALVSRTGLLIAVVCIVFVFLGNNKKSKKIIVLGSILSVLAVVLLNAMSVINISEFVEVNFNRFKVLFENGIYDSYLKVYLGNDSANKNYIPPISIYTILGLGITNGVSGTGIRVAADGAFLRNYAAMGLIVVTINYLLLYSFFRKIKKKSKLRFHRLQITLIGIVWFIGEFKEYFTYQIYFMCLAMLIFSFIENCENKKREMTSV